jgi:hypothetical protein
MFAGRSEVGGAAPTTPSPLRPLSAALFSFELFVPSPKGSLPDHRSDPFYSAIASLFPVDAR